MDRANTGSGERLMGAANPIPADVDAAASEAVAFLGARVTTGGGLIADALEQEGPEVALRLALDVASSEALVVPEAVTDAATALVGALDADVDGDIIWSLNRSLDLLREHAAA